MSMNATLSALIVAAVSAAALAGCADEPPGSLTGGPRYDPTVSAKDYYVSSVHPSLANTCASCHSGAIGPTFMTSTAEGTYTAMEQYGNLIVAPANSQLLLHGEHAGPALTAQQQSLVQGWLDREAAVRGSGGDGAPTVVKALEEVGACMSWDDWEMYALENLSMIPAKQMGQDAGVCFSCHNTGQGGAFFDQSSATTFLGIQDMPYVNRWFAGEVASNGSFAGLRAADRIVKKGDEAIACEETADETNAYCHPTFELTQELADAVQGFVDDTIARWDAQRCDEATQPPLN